MKRTLALIIALVIFAMALTSCGRDKVDLSTATSLNDLKGATIAAQTGTFHLEALESQTNGVTVKEFPDFDQLLVALNSGTIDGYVAEEPTAYSVIAQNEYSDYDKSKDNGGDDISLCGGKQRGGAEHT